MVTTRPKIPGAAVIETGFASTLVMTAVFVGMVTLSAQQPSAPAAPAKPAPADQSAAQNQPARAPAQAANIRMELKIVDQHGEAPATPKTLTLLIEDRQNGRIRNIRGPVYLNLDARPEIVRDGRIRVVISLEYAAGDNDKTPQAGISELVTALLEDGKPLVVSESADPGSDRRVRLELKATVVK
jgi:hypothetical protein